MSWFSREWDGVHREGCEQYGVENSQCPGELPSDVNHKCWMCKVENPPALADCQCPDIMVEEAVSAADYYLDQLREEQMP